MNNEKRYPMTIEVIVYATSKKDSLKELREWKHIVSSMSLGGALDGVAFKELVSPKN